MDQDRYIKKWLNDTLSEEERAVFEHSDTYHELQRLDHALKSFKAPEIDLQQSFDQLELDKPAGKVIELNWWKPWLRVAAMLIAAVAIYLFWPQTKTSFETVATNSGQTTQFVLPDHSEVVLNASSAITYDRQSWAKQRALNLTGEAYFKVSEGTQFKVETFDGIITVLGTEFNVKSRDNYFEVICYEGLVQVDSRSLSEQLPAMHMFRVINGTVIKSSNLNDTAPGWINKESTFISIPYREVLKELERQYQITVSAAGVDQSQLFTGQFPHEDLELALESITKPLNITYQIEDNQTVILSGENN